MSEWGYTEGIVKDVIRDILQKESPLSREEIIDRVLKERYVKGNTVIVNLQNSDFLRGMKTVYITSLPKLTPEVVKYDEK